MLTCVREIFFKMMTRLIFASFCSILSLLSVASWAANETSEVATAPLVATTPATASVQPSPAFIPPAKPATAANIPEKKAPAAADTIKPVAAVPAAKPLTPAKPAMAPPNTAASAVAAKRPFAAANRAPAQALPGNPIPTPLKPVPVTPPPTPASAKPATTTILPSKPSLVPIPQAKPAPVTAADLKTQAGDIEVFVREGCLNCDNAKEFLDKLQNIQPQIKIHIRDVRKEPAAMELLKRMAQNQSEAALDYPAFVVGGKLIVGFTEKDNTAQLILDSLPLTHSSSDSTRDSNFNCESGQEPSCGLIPTATTPKAEKISVTIFGYNISLVQIGLPLFTITLGLLDGLNFGSTWVLLLIISLLVPLKDRPKMLTIAGTFLAVQFFIYFLLMAAWLNFFFLINNAQITQWIVATIAMLAGVIYFKNYLYYGENLSLSSHEIEKPGIYTQIRKIVQARTILVALWGTIALAIFVQISEFTFTSVFPALYTKVLSMQKLGGWSNYAYLALYDVAYMLDDIIVLTVGLVTFNQARSKENNASMRWLISALVLLGASAYLFFQK